jgi:predicted transcriptional regulator of viral defense system
MSSGLSLQRQHSYKEAFLASLSRFVAVPTDDWPTVRIWTKPSLDRVFQRVRDEIGESKSLVSNTELIGWMTRLGLAWALETDAVKFYLLEMGASADSGIDPWELMMAYEPSGIVCYFSALAFHSLTSQMPSHHHVAVLTESSRSDHRQKDQAAARDGSPAASTSLDRAARAKGSPIGKVAFSYAGLPYYLTRRSRRLVPGIQNRSSGPRGRFRITTYEQSLLDTLHKPQNCGGPAVVLEAWQEATTSGRLDEERLVDYLVRMDYPSTSRRVGAMLQMIDHTPSSHLAEYLAQVKQDTDRGAPYAPISLLPGFHFSRLDEGWLVELP